jgi:O-methyltransferase involved in polyketide biosynthesis
MLSNVRFIPGNYVTDGLIHLLKQNGFDVQLPTYLIWEGNTMYLPLESTKHILAQLRQYVTLPGLVRLHGGSGDFQDHRRCGHHRSRRELCPDGRPWLSGIRNVQGLAHELRLNLIENFKTAELIQAYKVDRVMSSPIFKFYSLCTVGF